MKRTEVIKYTGGQDPKAVVLDKIGSHIDDITVLGNRVLVATAPHCETTKGGVILTDSTIEEERYQGKVGLVLKIGETAFRYDGQFEWKKPEEIQKLLHSWVFYRNPDSWECSIGGVSCRFIRDHHIVGVLKNHDMIW